MGSVAGISVPPFRALLHALSRLPARARDRRFWFIQAMVLGVAALHTYTEAGGYQEPFGSFHHIPVTLFLIPVAYASLHFRLEGGILTGLSATILTTPNILLWHTTAFSFEGELTQLAVVVAVGSLLSWRVEREVRQRFKAEEASARLQVSEEKYQNLFEAAGDAILVFGAAGELLAANAAAGRLTGYTLKGLTAMRADALLQASGWEAVQRSVTADLPKPIHLSLVTNRGSQVAVEATCALVHSQEGPLLQAVLRDVTEQQRQQQNLQSYASLVMRAQEEEQRRIARELHDVPVQSMVLICRDLATLLQSSDSLPDPVRRGLAGVRERAEETLGLLRRFSRELRPSVLDDLGFGPAIQALTEELSRRLGFRVHLEMSGTSRRLAPDTELGLFRIVQEALRNVEKHAGATQTKVAVYFKEGRAGVAVADNGQGFRAPARLGDLTAEGKLGLVGMEERARLLSGRLEVQSAPGKGTQISVEVPA
ncbi:MAG: sensor histidine kinase [Chloroflexi bacterium]|nr:sensor histidine kinase [Chloroflexota bacterium]